MQGFRWKFIARSMYLLPVICLFTCILQVLCTPTIFPRKEFDPVKDARDICTIARCEAGYKKDDDKMARMVCHRTREQRFKLKEEFEKIKDDPYCSGKDIVNYMGVGNEISYDQLVEDAFKPEREIYLHDLHREFKWYKKADSGTIVEILLSIPPMEKVKFIEEYDRDYTKFWGNFGKFEDDVDGLKGDFRNIVKELSKRERQPEKPVDHELAKKEADLLIAEISKWENHRCDLDRILIETPIQQLNATLFEFEQKQKKSLEDVIDKEMGNKTKKNAYKDMVRYGYNPIGFYARRLESAMKGLGTKDHTLNRIISIHCETDLAEIADIFKLNTATSLIDAIKSDTISHQKQLLCCLAGEKGNRETV